MRVHGLGRVLERVVGEVLPILDYGLVLEQLWGGRAGAVRPHGLSHKRAREGAYLVDVLALAEQLLPLPAGEHAELGADEADLARPPPRQGRCTAERDEFFELLLWIAKIRA